MRGQSNLPGKIRYLLLFSSALRSCSVLLALYSHLDREGRWRQVKPVCGLYDTTIDQILDGLLLRDSCGRDAEGMLNLTPTW
jgi:hypothetical protein